MFKKLLITSLIALSTTSAFAKQTDFVSALRNISPTALSETERKLTLKLMGNSDFSGDTLILMASLSEDEFSTAKKLAKKYPAYQFVVALYIYDNDPKSTTTQLIKTMDTLCPKIREACGIAEFGRKKIKELENK